MKYEKDIREKKSILLSKEIKDSWNKIQHESIFGRQKTMDYFYDLFYDLQQSLEENHNNIEKTHELNNNRILEFYSFIKKELEIKD